MKDWFVRNGCIRIFDGDIKREVFNLHSEDCVSSSSCTSLPENFKTEKYFKDTQEIIHLTTSDCMESWKMARYIDETFCERTPNHPPLKKV